MCTCVILVEAVAINEDGDEIAQESELEDLPGPAPEEPEEGSSSITIPDLKNDKTANTKTVLRKQVV